MVKRFYKLIQIIKNSFLDPKSVTPGDRDEYMRTEGWNEGLCRILYAARQLETEESPEQVVNQKTKKEDLNHENV